MILRLEQLKHVLRKKNIDSLFLTHSINISYLMGFKVRDSYLFMKNDEILLITDSRYSAEYKSLLRGKSVKIVEIDKTLINTLKKINKKYRIKNIAFEQEYVSFSFYQKLKQIFGKKLFPTKNIVEEMRLIKDAEELKLIRKAVDITLDAFKYIKKILKPGIKEIELAKEIERYVQLKGANGIAFDIIVASGPHSSFPHAQKTDRIISHNEPVLVDMGVDYKGYKSDLTRVFFLGRINTLFKKVYNTVESAQEKARVLISRGATIASIDKKVREFIEKNGFKNCFKHSLGHGVGLEVHELPKICPQNKKKLEAGMVFTLEPAIYLDNKFGVRIEDMVLVTNKGMETLSAS